VACTACADASYLGDGGATCAVWADASGLCSDGATYAAARPVRWRRDLRGLCRCADASGLGDSGVACGRRRGERGPGDGGVAASADEER